MTANKDHNAWLAITAATATIGAVGVALGLGTQLVSLLMEARGFSASTIGDIGTMGGIATIIAAACAARVAMYFGVVKSILIMICVGALSFIGFYLFQSITVWFVLRFTLHFAITIMFILSEFWVNHCAPTKNRGIILALYAIVLSSGFIVGPMILAEVGSEGPLPFIVGLALILLAIIPISCAWKLSPKFHSDEHVAFRQYIFAVPSSTMAVFVYGAIQMGALTLLTTFALSLHYTSSEATRFTALLALGNVLLLIPIGIISDRVKDRRYVLLACATIGLFGTLSIPYIADNKLLLSTAFFILGGVVSGLYTVGLAQLGARLKGQELAAANSAFIFFYGIGMLIGPSTLGHAMDFYHPFGFSIAMAVFFGFYVILVGWRVMVKSMRS